MATIIMSQASGGSPFFPCGPCATCFTFFGATMEVTLTGIAVCGCFEVSVFDTPPAIRYYTPVISSGVNGVFTLTNGVGPGGGWFGVIGVITLQESTFGGGTLPASTCPGTPIGVPFDVNVDMVISCDDTTHKLIAAATITLESGSPGVSSLIFTTGVTSFSAGAVVPSVLDCTDIDPDGYYRDAAGFGAITVTPP